MQSLALEEEKPQGSGWRKMVLGREELRAWASDPDVLLAVWWDSFPLQFSSFPQEKALAAASRWHPRGLSQICTGWQERVICGLCLGERCSSPLRSEPVVSA